jgi:hypothetical protein
MTNESLEVRLVRLEERAENRDVMLAKMSLKVDGMYDIMQQARGARWVLLAAATIGGAIAGFVAKFIPFFTGVLPK